jgi:RNA polymerase sigma-70 factor (ECF subfamily)
MEVTGLYHQFHQSLYNYIRAKVRTVEDAQDILQTVFTKITVHADTLSGKEKIQHWIFTITRNTIIDYYRMNAGKRALPVTDGFEDQLKDESSVDSTKGLDLCLHNLIALLPDDYRDIIMDSEIRGVPQKSLAEKYNMAYSSLRSRVQRGRERLKQILHTCCHIQVDRHGNILEARLKDSCNSPCSPDFYIAKKTNC